jgi:uncharacterized protein (DUF885 family)
MFLIVFGGPWLTIMASQSSLPGDLLYSVKKITEQVQMQVASQENKAQIQVDLAYRRLEELNKITADSFSNQEKQAKTKEIISDFKGNLNNISQNLGKVDKSKAMALAEKTEKIEKNLDQVKEEASQESQKDLVEAQKIVEELKQQIMAALIEMPDKNETASTSDGIIEINKDLETETTTPKIIR